ncbi:ChiC_BD domain containing protein [uncultured Caudovirales phage]|uniref:ChiC_BD domain containing protein n=1 Tax=uncultured Caudovirales phage TaxID=2100421 RepID=A0A6J5LD83_9CAUD|nr:ChiC_BD domain containing protein [uncultured Caudovirales phage]
MAAISVPVGDYQAPVDIANRGLQHVGARRIVTFQDNTKNAAEVSFCYDKLRKAELQRNIWTFSKRLAALRAVDTTVMKLNPAAYNSADTYVPGSVVTWNNHVYIAMQDIATSTQPDQWPQLWSLYFGPMTVSLWTVTGQPMGLTLWNSSVTYGAGAQVIGSDGNEYQSLQNNNTGNSPLTSPTYWTLLGLAPTQGPGYFAGELVYTPATESYQVYLSMINANTNIPGSVPAWSSTTVYNKDDVVTYSSTTYQSTGDLNYGNTPGVSGWEAIPDTQVTQQSGEGWLLLNATIQSIRFVYPIGAGPASQSETKNVFMLPNGYLRQARVDPKAGRYSLWGSETGEIADDYIFTDDYFVSSNSGPIIFCFVADICDVQQMHPLFCEGLACRVGLEVAEPLTQSTEKIGTTAKMYEKFMGEARTVNAIEQGAAQEPVDDWIATRR